MKKETSEEKLYFSLDILLEEIKIKIREMELSDELDSLLDEVVQLKQEDLRNIIDNSPDFPQHHQDDQEIISSPRVKFKIKSNPFDLLLL